MLDTFDIWRFRNQMSMKSSLTPLCGVVVSQMGRYRELRNDHHECRPAAR